jgi:hypothetical protein
MILNETVCFAETSEQAEELLNNTTLIGLMRQAKEDQVKKICLSGYSNARAVYVVGNPRVARILDNLIRDL